MFPFSRKSKRDKADRDQLRGQLQEIERRVAWLELVVDVREREDVKYSD